MCLATANTGLTCHGFACPSASPPRPLGPAEEGTALPIAQDHWRPAPGALLAHLHHPRPWYRGSLFGEGPRCPLSSNQRRAWLARAELERRAGNLTALHIEVARALLRRLGADGRCDPAQATLAADAGCGERTVRRALVVLHALGLLGRR